MLCASMKRRSNTFLALTAVSITYLIEHFMRSYLLCSRGWMFGV
nr:MAG TPA: hypothetical protein [Caudoviricetes sp.]